MVPELVEAARVEIGGRQGRRFRQLPLHADRTLQACRARAAWDQSDNMRRECWLRNRSGCSWTLRRETSGIVDDELLLHDAIHAIGLQDLLGLKAIVENSKAAADDNFWRGASSADSPGKSQARRPVAVIMNVILGFKTQASSSE